MRSHDWYRTVTIFVKKKISFYMGIFFSIFNMRVILPNYVIWPALCDSDLQLLVLEFHPRPQWVDRNREDLAISPYWAVTKGPRLVHQTCCATKKKSILNFCRKRGKKQSRKMIQVLYELLEYIFLLLYTSLELYGDTKQRNVG